MISVKLSIQRLSRPLARLTHILVNHVLEINYIAYCFHLFLLQQSQNWLLFQKSSRFYYLYHSKKIFFINQIIATQIDEIKIVACHSFQAFIIIIVIRKVTILQVAIGQLLIKLNVRLIEKLLIDYKKIINKIFADQVLH